MTPPNLEVIEAKWPLVLNLIQERFGKDSEPDLNAILMLIGVNELGQIKESWAKEEKEQLMHIGLCTLLENQGLFVFEGKDLDGWPHWNTNGEYPKLKLSEQESLIQWEMIKYFQV